MKILHTAFLKQYSSGIVNQMYSELNASINLELLLNVKIFVPLQVVPNEFIQLFSMYKPKYATGIKAWVEHRKLYYSWLKEQENDVDCYLIRYSVGDPLQYYFIKQSKKPVCLVHHTKELDEMHVYGIKGHILKHIDKVFGPLSIKNSYLTIGVTNEIIEYEMKRVGDLKRKMIVYPNGININQANIEDLRSNGIPEILFVASYFYDWHGLDLLIDLLEGSKKELVVHIVGSVNQTDYERMKLNKNFKLHGALSHSEIHTLAKQCWIGLGSFALYRKNMEEACTLKVREYLSMGLPVYSGHKDIFPESFCFYKHQPLELASLMDFCFKARDKSKQEVISASTRYISKEIIVKHLIDNLNLLIT